MRINIPFWSYLAQFFLEWELFQTRVVEEIKTHFMFCNFFFFENRAVFEIMWKNVERDRPQMTIWRMRIACWIAKATHTFAVCKTYCFSTAPLVARTRLNVMFVRTVHVLCNLPKFHSDSELVNAQRSKRGWFNIVPLLIIVLFNYTCPLLVRMLCHICDKMSQHEH
jgi:hypothetical protein